MSIATTVSLLRTAIKQLPALRYTWGLVALSAAASIATKDKDYYGLEIFALALLTKAYLETNSQSHHDERMTAFLRTVSKAGMSGKL